MNEVLDNESDKESKRDPEWVKAPVLNICLELVTLCTCIVYVCMCGCGVVWCVCFCVHHTVPACTNTYACTFTKIHPPMTFSL